MKNQIRSIRASLEQATATRVRVEEQQRAQKNAARAEYERQHPVSAGIIPLVDYVPPAGTYTPAFGNNYV